MNNKEKILKMYYEDKLKQNDIATILEISQSYIFQVIKKDDRYKSFKEDRHKKLWKKAEYNRNYLSNYDRPKHTDNSYQALQAQLAKDAQALSYKNSDFISDKAFVDWNRSIYNYDKNSSDLVLNKKFNVTSDVTRRVSDKINPNTRRVIC